MDPSQHSEPCYPTYNVLGSLQSHAPDFDLEPDQLFDQYTRSFASHHAPESHPTGMLPTQHATVYNPVGTFPARDHWHQLPLVKPLTVVGFINLVLTETLQGHGPLVNDRLSGPTGIFSIQPQVISLLWHSTPRKSANKTCCSAPICPMQKRLYRPSSRILRLRGTTDRNGHWPPNQFHAAWSLRRPINPRDTKQRLQALTPSTSWSMA